MFGYIKPFAPELKVREAEAYKAVYCGLCRTLFHEYGPVAAMLVNYDMVFAAMLLTEGGVCPTFEKGRCAASPFKKKCYAASLPSLELAAAATVINTWHKLSDDAADEGFFKRLFAKLIKLLIRRKYKKAAEAYPEIAFETADAIALYQRLEEENCKSIDRMTDAVGKGAASMAAYSVESREIRERILYNQARFITVADALDDYQKDLKKKRYNLLCARYGEITSEVRSEVRTYVLHIMNEQYALFGKLEKNAFSGITGNILTLGVEHTINDLLKKQETEEVTKHA